ncbi:MAG: hypothetical protein HYX51_10835 [Chloroflexi bacterium]|nr:hypothetical protein [Chloroflexota bacterium]
MSQAAAAINLMEAWVQPLDMHPLLAALLDPATNHLRPGYHELSWEQLRDVLGFNAHRLRLLDGLEVLAGRLRTANCLEIVLGGSFASPAPEPKDIDGVWIRTGVDLEALRRLAPKVYESRDSEMKRLYTTEIYPARWIHTAGDLRLNVRFFETTRTGFARGMVRIRLDRFSTHRVASTGEGR